MKKEKSCGIIVVKDNKVLMVEQSEGFMAFPKGHIEPGETEQETAIREVKEETNVDAVINSDNKFRLSYIMDNGVYKEVVYFLGYPINNNQLIPQEGEINQVKWIDIDKVRDTLTFDNIRNLWDEILKVIYK